jgi:hypothetical protein
MTSWRVRASIVVSGSPGAAEFWTGAGATKVKPNAADSEANMSPPAGKAAAEKRMLVRKNLTRIGGKRIHSAGK